MTPTLLLPTTLNDFCFKRQLHMDTGSLSAQPNAKVSSDDCSLAPKIAPKTMAARWTDFLKLHAFLMDWIRAASYDKKADGGGRQSSLFVQRCRDDTSSAASLLSKSDRLQFPIRNDTISDQLYS